MDKLFKSEIDEMMKELEEIENEIKEMDIYPDDDFDRMTKRAYDCLKGIFIYMKKYHRKKYWTIPNALKELYLIATTGEMSRYQEMEEVGLVSEAFSGLSGEESLAIIQHATRVLSYKAIKYYTLHGEDEKWKKVDDMACKIMKLERLDLSQVMDRQATDSEGIPEENFMSELKKHLDINVIGQETLKKKLISILYQWIYNNERTTLLIVGPTGSGKNHTIETIKNFKGMDRVLISYDCSGLTPAGFSGSDVKDIFNKLISTCKDRGKQTEGSIVYLDEVDKIINFNHDSHGDSVNALVQQQLLSSLAGTETIRGVDTGKILFILGGAFPRIDELKQKKSVIGFNTSAMPMAIDCKMDLREELCTIGGEREFIGRIEEIVQMSRLTRNELKAILLDKNIGAFTRKKELFDKAGLELEIEEDAVETIVDLVVKENAGARAVKHIVNEFADSRYFFDMKTCGFDKMIIHKGMFYGEAPILTESKRKNY